MRLSCLLRSVALALGVVVAGASTAVANIREPTIVNPDDAVKAHIAANRGEIKRQLEVALNPGQQQAKRLEAVRYLSGANFDYLLANAEPLIKSDDEALSQATVSALAARIAMVPEHSKAHTHGASADDTYESSVVTQTLQLLELALNLPLAGPRNEAAAFLAARGHTGALTRIQRLIDEGKLSGKQGVGYLSLAPTHIASPFIQKYAVEGDPDTQAAAVGQLAYNPIYTAQMRDLALKSTTSPKVLIAALPGLAATDSTFLTYGVALAQNKDRPAEVREQAVESTVRFAKGTKVPLSTVVTFTPLLEETVKDLASPRARGAVHDLKAAYSIDR